MAAAVSPTTPAADPAVSGLLQAEWINTLILEWLRKQRYHPTQGLTGVDLTAVEQRRNQLDEL